MIRENNITAPITNPIKGTLVPLRTNFNANGSVRWCTSLYLNPFHWPMGKKSGNRNGVCRYVPAWLGGHAPPPVFGRPVNPILTRGQIMPNTLLLRPPSQIFGPSAASFTYAKCTIPKRTNGLEHFFKPIYSPCPFKIAIRTC